MGEVSPSVWGRGAVSRGPPRVRASALPLCLQAVAPTDTLRVLFINRHYEEGRNILNQPKLAHLME